VIHQLIIKKQDGENNSINIILNSSSTAMLLSAAKAMSAKELF